MAKLTFEEELLIECTTDDIHDIDYNAFTDKRKKCKYTGNEYFIKVEKILIKLVKKINKSNHKSIRELEFTIETLLKLKEAKKEIGEYLNIEIEG